MKEQIQEILSTLKSIKIPPYKIEKDLGFSNGLLSKGSLSIQKFKLLCSYFEQHAIGVNGKEFTYFIYGLVNPENDSIFYVGCTRQELKLRLSAHLVEGRFNPQFCKPSRKQAIISKLLENKQEPNIRVLETITGLSSVQLFMRAIERETHWILELNPVGNDKKTIPAIHKRGIPTKAKNKHPRRAVNDILAARSKIENYTEPPVFSYQMLEIRKKKLGI